MLSPKINLLSLSSHKIIHFDSMKDLTHTMRNMNVTNSLKASVVDKISQVVAFGGLGEDQNISLATERWKINNRWKTPSAIRCIAKFFTAIETLFNSDRSLKI